MHLAFRVGDQHLAIDVQRAADSGFAVTVNGEAHQVAGDLVSPQTLRLTIDGRSHVVRLVRVGSTVHVTLDGSTYRLEPDSPIQGGGEAGGVANPLVVAPMPGKVLKVLVSVGQHVAAGDALIILEAMKMETRIRADGAATVRRIAVDEGQMVEGGALLVELDPSA